MSSAEYNRRKREELKKKGICTRCWKRKAKEGYTKCEVCLSDNTLFRGIFTDVEFKERTL